MIGNFFGPGPRYIINSIWHAAAGYSYGNIHNISPKRCAWIFGITSLANNIIRHSTGFLMVLYLDKPKSFVRAKVLLDVATYSITIFAFRQFGINANKGTLVLSALATCLTLGENFKYFNPSTADQAAAKFMDRIKHGHFEDLESIIWQ